METSRSGVSGGLVSLLLAVTQFAFVIFLFTGHFKGHDALAWFPLDLTLVAATLLTVLAVLCFCATGGRLRTEAFWMVLFFSAMAAAALWTEWTPYALEKASHFYSVTLLAALAPAILLPNPKAIRRFVFLVVIFGLVVSSGVLMQLAGGGFSGGIDERTASFTSTTTALAWDAGQALAALYVCMFRGGKWLRVAPICVLLLVAMVASGARGPLFLAVLLLAVMTLLFGPRNRFAIIGTIALLMLSGVAVNEFSSHLPQGSIRRINAVLQGQDDASADARRTANLAAIDAVIDNPMGMGFGGFARVYNFGGGTDRIFPHNLVMEIASENGIFVAVLFVGIMALALTRSYHAARKSVELQPFFAMLVFATANTLISGELNADRLAYALLTIGLQLRGPSVAPLASGEL